MTESTNDHESMPQASPCSSHVPDEYPLYSCVGWRSFLLKEAQPTAIASHSYSWVDYRAMRMSKVALWIFPITCRYYRAAATLFTSYAQKLL